MKNRPGGGDSKNILEYTLFLKWILVRKASLNSLRNTVYIAITSNGSANLYRPHVAVQGCTVLMSLVVAEYLVKTASLPWSTADTFHLEYS